MNIIFRYLAVSKPISAFVEDGGCGWRRVMAYVGPVIVFVILFNIPTYFELYVSYRDEVSKNDA